MIGGFVMTNRVNVTVMLDQVLEEGMGKDSIARKTIQSRFTLQQDCSFFTLIKKDFVMMSRVNGLHVAPTT